VSLVAIVTGSDSGIGKASAVALAEAGYAEISTPMTGQADVDPHTQDRPEIPLERPGSAWEVAELVVHLARSTYTTGSSYVIDGGLLLTGADR
jgi:hypothetical protein